MCDKKIIQGPSHRPNIIALVVLLYWLFIPEYVLIPHVIVRIENLLGGQVTGFAWTALLWFLRLGVPIAGYVIYLLFAKKRLIPAFSIARLPLVTALYIVVLTAAIRAVDLLAIKFIPFALGSVPVWHGSPLWQALIVSVLFAVLYEEFIFRGFLYSEYQNQRVSIWKTALATGLFFGLIHSGIAVFTTAAFGIIWAYMLYRTRSIWAPVLSHAVYNALGTLLNPMYYTGSQADYEALMSAFLIAVAIAAVILVPLAVICAKRFFAENPREKDVLPVESKAFTWTYWALIIVMIAAIFIFRI